MKIRYKYFKDYNDAFVYFAKSISWFFDTPYGIRFSDDKVINNELSPSIALYDKKTGEVMASAELHYSLCGKYVVINRYYDFYLLLRGK